MIFKSLREFYPFYLSEHTNRTSRRLHFIGTCIGLGLLITSLITQAWWLLPVALIQGYGFSWVGHLFFEHNMPATFKYPRLSFLGDLRLWWEMLTGKIKF